MSVTLLRRLACPCRALKKPPTVVQASSVEEEETNTVAHIPREFAKDTIEFFRQSSPHVKSLLDLVFSTTPNSSEAYETAVEQAREKFRAHEERARRKMFDAIKNLPSDLYEEAVKKGDMLPPASLQFHAMYKDQLPLEDWELVQMQTFANLMHVRYSHSEAKAKHRDRFFISESAALNLRKERAKKEKTG